MGKRMKTNLWVEFIDALNGKLHVTGMDGVTNVYSFLASPSAEGTMLASLAKFIAASG